MRKKIQLLIDGVESFILDDDTKDKKEGQPTKTNNAKTKKTRKQHHGHLT